MMKKREFGSSFLKSMGFLLFRMIEMGRCKKTVAEGFFMVKRKGERVRLTEAREGGKNKRLQICVQKRSKRKSVLEVYDGHNKRGIVYDRYKRYGVSKNKRSGCVVSTRNPKVRNRENVWIQRC